MNRPLVERGGEREKRKGSLPALSLPFLRYVFPSLFHLPSRREWKKNDINFIGLDQFCEVLP